MALPRAVQPQKRDRSPEACSGVSDACLQSLDAELCRSRLAFELSTKLRRVCTDAGITDTGILVGFVFESIAATSSFAKQHPSGNDDRRTWVRRFVHPVLDRDTRCRVTWRTAQPSSEPCDATTPATVGTRMSGTLTGVKFLNGDVVGSVAVEWNGPSATDITQPSSASSSSSNDPALVDVVLADLELVEPQPLDLDPLLPCGEIILPHHSPQSVFMQSLSKLCDKDTAKSVTYKAKKRMAWAVADAATALARDARRAMAAHQPRATPCSISVSYDGLPPDECVASVSAQPGTAEVFPRGCPQDTVCLTLEHPELAALPIPTTHRIVRWQFDRLKRHYEASVASADLRRIRAEEAPHMTAAQAEHRAKLEFPFRLFTLLQRYSVLTTQLPSREEAGWHAAMPPEVLAFLQERMNVQAECFASPLNAQLPSYCSAFRDTDKWFGSLGPFLEFRPSSGCYEVNPPFDHEVCRLAFDHALACVEAAAKAQEPLGFIFIIPHSNRDSGLKVRGSVDNSPFHVASAVLPREEAKYVDGFQHLPGTLHQQLVPISCPTRVVFLMNPKACEIWPPMNCLKELKVLWASTSGRT